MSGAGGGTVIHAKGTGLEKAERFLGVSIADEKEMIFIVCQKQRTRDRHYEIHHGPCRYPNSQCPGGRVLPCRFPIPPDSVSGQYSSGSICSRRTFRARGCRKCGTGKQGLEKVHLYNLPGCTIMR